MTWADFIRLGGLHPEAETYRDRLADEIADSWETSCRCVVEESPDPFTIAQAPCVLDHGHPGSCWAGDEPEWVEHRLVADVNTGGRV